MARIKSLLRLPVRATVFCKNKTKHCSANRKSRQTFYSRHYFRMALIRKADDFLENMKAWLRINLEGVQAHRTASLYCRHPENLALEMVRIIAQRIIVVAAGNPNGSPGKRGSSCERSTGRSAPRRTISLENCGANRKFAEISYSRYSVLQK